MHTADRIRRSLIRQFHNPTGPGGHLAGWVMGHRRSNVARNRWAAGLLGLGPGGRALELGCGPGVALAALVERVDGADGGLVVGVDHSPVMIRHARRRNAAAVAAGRARLVFAPVEDLLAGPPGDGDGGDRGAPAAPFDRPFDAVLAVNNVGFWPDPPARLAAARRLLRPGGRIALVSQPRCPGATAETTRAAGEELAALLAAAGYAHLDTATLDLDPPVACVRATNP